MEKAPVYLSTAYLAPVQYYTKLCHASDIRIEACENYLKQTYRNRCTIAAANGIQSLSIPIVKPGTLKCLTRDIRISDHGNWRHLHWNAIVSAYNMTPFFEYYEEDFAPFYEKKYDFLFDFNEELRRAITGLLDICPSVTYTEEYVAAVAENDFREGIRPKHPLPDPAFSARPYYQVFQERHRFIPNLSIIDLLFNMGPESILVLRDSGTN